MSRLVRYRKVPPLPGFPANIVFQAILKNRPRAVAALGRFSFGSLRIANSCRRRFLGDKRVQVVYDLDDVTDESVIEELADGPHALAFGPDTLAEARNRGYRLRST